MLEGMGHEGGWRRGVRVWMMEEVRRREEGEEIRDEGGEMMKEA